MHARFVVNVGGSIRDSVALVQRASECCANAPAWQGLGVTLARSFQGGQFPHRGVPVCAGFWRRVRPARRRGHVKQAIQECEAK